MIQISLVLTVTQAMIVLIREVGPSMEVRFSQQANNLVTSVPFLAKVIHCLSPVGLT